MIEFFLMTGLMVAGSAIAWAVHSEKEKAQARRWAAAADALGEGAVHRSWATGHVVEGEREGMRFIARMRTETRNKKTEEYVDVTATVRLPLPHGLVIEQQTGFDAVRNLFGTTSPRANVVRVGPLHVRAGDVGSARTLFGRAELQTWLRECHLRCKRFGVLANRVTMAGFGADSPDMIVSAVRAAIRTTQELEDAISWRPERHRRLALEGAEVRAFGVEAPAEAKDGGAREAVYQAQDDAASEPGLIDRMMSNLSSEGTVVDESGAFTIDRAAALEKLRSSRVDRSATFVLEILRAAALRGASQIRVAADADDLEIVFDGEPFSRRDLEDAFGAAFSSSPHPGVAARRHLALGLEGALGISPRFVELQGPLASMRREPGEEDRFEDGDPQRDATRFAVKLRLLDRMRGGAFGEILDMIRHHAIFMSAAVSIDEQLIERGPPHERWWGQLDLCLEGSSAPIEAFVGFGAGDVFGPSGRAWLGRHQVWIETRELRHATPYLRVAVMAHDFNTDLSGQRLVDDDETQGILAAIDAHIEAAVVRLARDYGEGRRRHDPRLDAVAGVLRALAMDTLSWEQLRKADRHEPGSVPHALISAKVWPAFDGHYRSLRDLNRNLEDDRVPFVSVGLHATTLVHGKLASERLRARLSRGLSAHAVDVSKLDAHERQWIASVFGNRLEDETWDMLKIAQS